MAFDIRRLLLTLLFVVGLLAMDSEVACGLRTLRTERGGAAASAATELRARNGADVAELNTKKRSVSASSTVDATQMSKRRVRRGSDPIHNRSWTLREFRNKNLEESSTVGGEEKGEFKFTRFIFLFLRVRFMRAEICIYRWKGKKKKKNVHEYNDLSSVFDMKMG